jgi:glycosyltransferase involved in cell wall biosynthesis
VSVVVPTRNRADKLRVCVESLLAQDFPADSYEIVVVDDGSTDDTLDVAASMPTADNGPAVTVVAQDAQGAGAARNIGLAVARGDPVCFVDDDIEAPPTWLAAMAQAFERYPEADAFGGRLQVRVEDPEWRGCRRHPIAASLELGTTDTDVPSAVGVNMALRRRALVKVGAFDDWVVGGDDTEWFDRLTAAGGTTMYVGGASVWHRRDASDVRIWPLLRSSFRRGVATYSYFLRLGRRDTANWAVRAALTLLRAAVRERCPGALANAAVQAGYAYGLFRHRHVDPPPPRIWEAPAPQEWTVVRSRRSRPRSS